MKLNTNIHLSQSPLISILSHLWETATPIPSLQFLYITRSSPSPILFLSRLHSIFASTSSLNWSLHLYLTSSPPTPFPPSTSSPKSTSNPHKSIKEIHHRRITQEDLKEALGPVAERDGVVAYVCGPAGMTDEITYALAHAEGMEQKRVLCERWW